MDVQLQESNMTQAVFNNSVTFNSHFKFKYSEKLNG